MLKLKVNYIECFNQIKSGMWIAKSYFLQDRFSKKINIYYIIHYEMKN